MSSAPARLRVGVISAGRVGAVLGAALAAAGHSVVAASAVSDASRRRAAELLPTARIAAPPEVLDGIDLALLAVPDDELPELVAGLAAVGAFRAGTLVAHTSGRYGLGVLDPAREAGCLPLALHPAMTFTGSDTDLPRLRGASFGVTAPDELVVVAQALVLEMGGEPVTIADELRATYHAALSHGANHLVTLVGQAGDLLRAAGAEDPAKILGPLLTAALDNTLRSGDAALTGPVARGDAGTVAAHLAAVAEHGPTALPAYTELARATADRALAARLLAPSGAATLLGVLARGQR
ncbi:MAG: hypothetical protein JWM48_1368 [Mycobacterium sp.]|jgi:predicted short-subunit dehydrogenase-like oxidoreductase (DUF2520 family)|nr:hypothetical protein [Mycobacterium sp.]MCW2744818.1 hypothetical protein [Mycobacterium sp.]